VEGRKTLQALQAHIAAARSATARGDREAALAEVDAALAIDPHFAAAQMLRDQLRAGASAVPAVLESQPIDVAATSESTAQAVVAAAMAQATAPPRFAQGVSAERYEDFQARAKRRRVERRVEAARHAIERGRLHEAAAALDEITELDAACPELQTLTSEFAALRRRVSASHRGPSLAAAAVFVATILGASYLQEASSLMSRQMATAGALMPAVMPSATALIDVVAVGTTGERANADLLEPLRGIEASRAAAPVASDLRPAAVTTMPRIDDTRIAETRVGNARVGDIRVGDAVLPIQPLTLPPPPPSAAALPAAVPAAMPVAEVRRLEPAVERVVASVPIDESTLVRGVLQRYRTAYQDLDATSARAVWPAVNESALARAFNGLESQTLTFDACDVRVNGDAATATCRGSARYVPKVGSREPRIEPRTWSFTLKKNGPDWKIDTARASQ
jgi:hypothetical protein